MWIIFTILILALVYYRLYKTENGNALASLALLGSAIGISTSLTFLRSNTIYIQDNVLSNIVISVWVLCMVFIALTYSSKSKPADLLAAGHNVVNARQTEIPEQSSRLPGLIEQSVDALNKQNYDEAVDLLETAITFSKDLGTELKLRTELAFAYQLSGEHDLAKEQLETGMMVAQELGDSWVNDLSNAVDRLKGDPAVKVYDN